MDFQTRNIIRRTVISEDKALDLGKIGLVYLCDVANECCRS